MWGCGLDQAGSGQGQVAGTCEYSNEPSRSIKCREFLDQLRTGQLLKKDCAPWSKYVSNNDGLCTEAVGPKDTTD